jgi:hypothetical protein
MSMIDRSYNMANLDKQSHVISMLNGFTHVFLTFIDIAKSIVVKLAHKETVKSVQQGN